MTSSLDTTMEVDLSTPRTEQAAQKGLLVIDGGWRTEKQDWVHAGFARQLERELAGAKARIKELENYIEDDGNEWARLNDR